MLILSTVRQALHQVLLELGCEDSGEFQKDFTHLHGIDDLYYLDVSCNRENHQP